MLDLKICPSCGDRADFPQVRDERLVCGECGHGWSFRRLPLFAVTGPSAGGKSTVGPVLADRLRDTVVALEQDVLWTGGLRDDVEGHPLFRSTWLRMAAMIGQSGRPVVLCGTVVPAEFEPLPERVFFSRIHYLALVAEPDVLAARLRARPAWREWDEPRIAEMLAFNEWLRADAATMSPPVDLLDTTDAPVADIASRVTEWIKARLPPDPREPT
ncbi:nucleoside kinase [Prauserella marina]|uniref:Broad-specificity NMP kinase n=1 Tax=Prauserella marina TaxID=530584 RepID=A0A222VJI0_9PSEU|nr:AAA family ATPase [Prauserella marina]ASR33923.1 nucleoside kinase [Prauserella marina]PWV82521.1 broad-specificity NMP kinase [Prauserella marina]SDC71136.1 Broad-specificity NMP kinase [Prauserella marina]